MGNLSFGGIFLFFFLKKKAAPVGHPEIPAWSGTETPAAPAGWHTSRCRSRRGKACPCEENGPKNATLRASRRRRAALEEGELGRGGHLLVGRSLMAAELPAAVGGVNHLPGVPVRPSWAVGIKRGQFWLPPAPSPPLFHPRSSQPLGPPQPPRDHTYPRCPPRRSPRWRGPAGCSRPHRCSP